MATNQEGNNIHINFPVNPSSKAPSIDMILSAITGKSRELTMAENKCMVCKGDASDFKDSLSFREYHISGMCQGCQESIFT